MKCTAKNSRPAPSFVWTVDELTLNHKTENVFDEDYERIFEGVSEPARNFKIAASYQFGG